MTRTVLFQILYLGSLLLWATRGDLSKRPWVFWLQVVIALSLGFLPAHGGLSPSSYFGAVGLIAVAALVRKVETT